MDGKIQVNGNTLDFRPGIYVTLKKQLIGSASDNGDFTFDISGIGNPILIPSKVNSLLYIRVRQDGNQVHVRTIKGKNIGNVGDRQFIINVYGR